MRWIRTMIHQPRTHQHEKQSSNRDAANEKAVLQAANLTGRIIVKLQIGKRVKCIVKESTKSADNSHHRYKFRMIAIIQQIGNRLQE